MTTIGVDKVFTGAIPKFYDTFLVPLIFAPYAEDLAQRVAACKPARVLEIAAGTGVVTRAMDRVLPASASITATDLNQAMLDHAASMPATRDIVWQQADAMQLPFEDESFNVVVCQFGVMFFPDKVRAFAEARRVLDRGGVFLFNSWDRIEENEFADVVTSALAEVFPQDPPRFLARTPHGYHDREEIRRHVESAGFDGIDIATIAARSRATSPAGPAIAYCQGTPLRNEIEARDASRRSSATDAATRAVARQFGEGSVDGKIQAHVVTARP